MSNGPVTTGGTGDSGGTAKPSASPPREIDREKLKTIASRIVVGDWIATERREYADGKYADGSDARHRAVLDMHNFGICDESEWWVFITNYLKRAQLLGIDTPSGMQTFGKTIVTMLHAYETAVMVFGHPPMPGVPSGTIEPWRRE